MPASFRRRLLRRRIIVAADGRRRALLIAGDKHAVQLPNLKVVAHQDAEVAHSGFTLFSASAENENRTTKTSPTKGKPIGSGGH